MTTTEMIDLMGAYIRDTDDKLLSIKLKLLRLNNAYKNVIGKLHRHYLSPLHAAETDLPLDEDGAFDLGDLTDSIWEKHRGIQAVRYKDGYSAMLISIMEQRQLWRENWALDADNPGYLPRGDKIFCKPAPSLVDIDSGDIEEGKTYYNLGYNTLTYNGIAYSTNDTFVGVAGVTTYSTAGTGIVAESGTVQLIDIYYIKDVTDMDESATDCVLSTRVQEVIVKLACESENAAVFKDGMEILEQLNNEAPATESNIIGRGVLDGFEPGNVVPQFRTTFNNADA